MDDIMGDIFALGFGPFRWVCTSGSPDDLQVTDELAAEVCSRLRDRCTGEHRDRYMQHYNDNYRWIVQAGKHQMVVGSQARILYSDAEVCWCSVSVWFLCDAFALVCSSFGVHNVRRCARSGLLAQGRCEIALAFNRAVREGRLGAPIVISRDHHDVSGTDSPFRETTSIKDGSRFCAGGCRADVLSAGSTGDCVSSR